MNHSLLFDIDRMIDISETEVMIAICESYQKIMNMFVNSDNESIILESCLIMESEDNGNKSSIKNILTRIFDFFKKVVNKIANHFKKILDKKKEIIYVTNCLRIVECLKFMNKPSMTQEAFVDDKERKEALKRMNEKKKIAKAVHKDLSNRNEKDVAKNIKKTFNKNNLYYDLSVNDIRSIVSAATSDLTDEEFNKLKKLINDTEIGMNEVNPKYEKKLKQILGMSKYMNESNKVMVSMRADFNIKRQSDKDKAKVEKDLNVLKAMSESLGKTLNDISNTSVFEFDNIKNIVYGGHTVRSSIGAVANWLAGCLKNIPELLKNASEYERTLYDTHHDMTDYFEQDVKERKELGIKTNKLLAGTMFMLDNIKEETYGWKDDVIFNNQSYGQGNPVTMIMGGPFTVAFKIVNYLITKDSSVFVESFEEEVNV